MKQLLVAALLSLAIVAPAASAATARSTTADAPASTNPAPAPAPSAPVRATPADASHWKPYVGAQLGDSIVGGLMGMQINRTYSLEGRYDYVDPIYQPNHIYKSSSAGISGLAMFPLKLGNMEPFFIFAKAGYERTKDKTTTSDPGLPGFSPPTTTITIIIRKRVTAGAGAQYDFSNNVSGRIGVNAVGSNHTVYITAIYKFLSN